MRSNNEIACRLPLGGISQPGIKIGREKDGAWKHITQRLQDQKLIVHITTQHADRLEFPILRFLLLQCRSQPDDVIQLAAALGSMPVLLARSWDLTLIPRLAFGLGFVFFLFVSLGG